VSTDTSPVVTDQEMLLTHLHSQSRNAPPWIRCTVDLYPFTDAGISKVEAIAALYEHAVRREKRCWVEERFCLRCGDRFEVIRMGKRRGASPSVCGICAAGWARKSRQRRRTDRLDAQIDRRCDICCNPMSDGRADRRQCSPACRQKAYRKRATPRGATP